jgi:hypothetical protein
MAYPEAAGYSDKWPDGIIAPNKMIEKANNKWSEYGID